MAMETPNSYAYADSGDSSPRSRDIDCENPAWEEQPSNYKVKFMCSYGGKIQPKPHDNQLTYIGGDTKILAVDRNIKFSDLVCKISSFCDSPVIFKYQLPGEDLDALISVTNDEDLEHMMSEYDRIHRLSPKPPRLRLFLFPQKNLTPKSFDSNESNSKPNQQWLADAMNSVPILAVEPSPQDFFLGFEKTGIPTRANIIPPAKLPESEIHGAFPSDISARSEFIGDDRSIGEPVVSPTISQMEIQRQIQELQRLQIANQEQQAMFRKNSDEALSRAFHADYYVPEKSVPVPVAVVAPAAPPPATVTNAQTYWQDINGGYTTATGKEQHQHQMYMLQQTQAGMYQTSAGMQTVTGAQPLPPAGMYQTSTTVQQQGVSGQVGQVSQGYYTMQRGPPDVYREQPVYGVGPPQPKIIARPGGVGGVMGTAETGYAQVAYDNTGRQVYYTAAAPGSVMPASYQTVVGTAGVDLRQVVAPPLNLVQEGKVVATSAAV